jgi:hypothetical protein
MNREDIIRMAREQGLPETATEGVFIVNTDDLGRILAAEREACAVACDDIEVDRWSLFKGRAPYTGQEDGRASSYVQGESDGAGKCAAAIRARSNA